MVLYIADEKLSLESEVFESQLTHLSLLSMPSFLALDLANRKILSIVFFGIMALLFATQGMTQVGTTPVPVDTTKHVKQIEAVPMASIGTETEATLNKLRTFKDRVQPTKAEKHIDDLMPKQIKAVSDLKKNFNIEKVDRMNLRQSESVKNDFGQLHFQLEGWRNSLMDISKEVNDVDKELSEVELQWQKTLDFERDEELPQIVVDRIHSNIEEIKLFDGYLKSRNDTLLTKLDELTAAIIFIDDVLAALTKTERSQRSNVFSLSNPPIWQSFSVQKDTISSVSRMKNLYHMHLTELNSFGANYSTNMYYHIVFFIIMLVLSFYLKREVAHWPDKKKDEAIRISLQVISKPFSVSLLITLLLSGLFYPDVSTNILNYFYILLVIPILITIPSLFPGIKKQFFYATGAIFALTQAIEFIFDLVFMSRIFLLLLNVVTIIMLWYLHRSRHTIQEKSPKVKWGFAFSLIYLNIFLLFIAVLANVLGNTILSHILSRGALTVIFGGMLAYAGSVVLRGMVSLLLQVDNVAKLNVIKNYEDDVKKKISQIISGGFRVYWFYLVLSGYLLWEPLYDWANTLLTNEWELGSLSISLGSIMLFIITIWLSMLISRFIRFVLQEEILLHFDLPRGVPGAISMLVRLAIITVGFILALGAANIPLDNLTIIFGALGVGIGFGLQNIFNNLVSGLILAFERPIQIGDVIQIASLNLMGEVKEIGFRASTVRTFDGAEVIVPNGNLISNEMINWTLSDHRRRQEVLVGVAYGTDVTKVIEILNNVVAEQEFVLKVPNPTVLFLGFGDSSLDFKVLFWTHFDHGISTKSQVSVAINEAFAKASIEIPFPQRDLHIRSGLEKFEKVTPAKEIAKTKPTKKKGEPKPKYLEEPKPAATEKKKPQSP